MKMRDKEISVLNTGYFLKEVTGAIVAEQLSCFGNSFFMALTGSIPVMKKNEV
jgi:hypothetical protein